MTACGDDDASADASLPDSGGGADAPAIDAAATVDAGGASDAGDDSMAPLPDTGVMADSGPSSDAAAPDAGTDAGSDAGPDTGPGVCDGVEIGNACASSRDCTGGTHECVEGLCRPSERLGCRSAGMMCPSRTTPTCVLPAGSRTGFCVTEEEALCVCTDHTDGYNCR